MVEQAKNQGGGNAYSLNRLLKERRELLVDPDNQRESLATNWHKIQRVAPSSREEMANLPHWERSALQNSLTAGSPQALDQIIGNAAIKQAAANELQNLWTGGVATTPDNDWDMASDDERWNKADDEEEQQPQNQYQPNENTIESPEAEPEDTGEIAPEEEVPEPAAEPTLGEAVPEAGKAAEAGEAGAKAAAGLGDAAAVGEGGAAVAGAAGGAEALAGAGAGAAATTEVAVAGAAVSWEAILIVIGVVALLLVGFTALNMIYPDTTKATTTTSEITNGAAAVVAKAKTQIGKPYVWGGCQDKQNHPEGCGVVGPEGRIFPSFSDNGFDCSAFVSWAWYWGSDKKVNLPAYTKGMYSKMQGDPDHFQQITRVSDLEPGDIILYSRSSSPLGIHHVAIYVGNGNRIHAWYTGANILINSIGSGTKFMFRPINY